MSEKEIREAVKDKKIVVGSKSVIKSTKRNELSLIIYAENCSQELLNQIKHYSDVSRVKSKKFDGNSEKLGETCAKPFNIMVVGIKK